MAITFEARLPRSLPDAVTVYQLPRPSVTNTALATQARAFGLDGGGRDFIASADRLAYREGRYELEVLRKSGALQFRHLDRYGRESDTAFEVTDRRATAVARRFIEKSDYFPLESAGLRAVTHLRGATSEVDSRQITERLIDAGVVYGRLVDGVPVDGPGGFAMVHVDAAAEVVGLRAVWRPLGKRQARVRIKAPDEAIRDLETLASGFKGDTTVTKAGFGYFEQGPLDTQAVLEPVFWFVYVVRNRDVAHKSAFVVHAGDTTFAPLLGKKRFAGPTQRPRREG